MNGLLRARALRPRITYGSVLSCRLGWLVFPLVMNGLPTIPLFKHTLKFLVTPHGSTHGLCPRFCLGILFQINLWTLALKLLFLGILPRRFQAYLRRARSSSCSPALAADQCYTWRAIRNAKGFSGFTTWWSQRGIKCVGAPDELPLLPPSATLAEALFLDFEANYRSFEQWHVRQRTKVIKAKHHDHNKLLFHQMRPCKAGSVSHLKVRHSRLVCALHEGNLVELDSPLPVLASATWTLDDTPVTVSPSATPGLYTLDGVDFDPSLVGATLTATTFQTDFECIESQLHELWEPIWQRHADVAIHRWDRVIAFGEAFLPSLVGPQMTWTPTTLRTVISQYKKKVTRGPDAWGRLDLLGLSDLRRSLSFVGTCARWYSLAQSVDHWLCLSCR